MILELVPNAMPATEVDVGIVTKSLNHIIHVLSDGYSRVSGAATALMWIFVALDVAILGAMLVLELEAWQGVFKKTLVISGWLYFIQDFEKHANSIVNSLVTLGLMLGGQEGTNWRQVLDPSRLLAKGFTLTHVLLQNLPPWYMMSLSDWLGYVAAFILIMLAFFIIAANAYMLVIGFYMSLGICGALLPFGLLPWTRDYAMKAVTAVVGHGVHLMLVAVATALAETVVQNLTFAQDRPPTMHEMWAMIFVVGVLALLAWVVPQRFAQSIMNGSASLGAADITRPAMSGAMMAAGAAAGAAGVAKAAGIKLIESHSERRDEGRREVAGRVSQSIQPLERSASPGGGASSTRVGSSSGGTNGGGGMSSSAAPRPNDPILSRPGDAA